jgi:hypothetical protein
MHTSVRFALSVCIFLLVQLNSAFAKNLCNNSDDSISEPASETKSNTEAEPITFAKQVAPIIYEKCSICHRPGQVGPFSLIAFDDVKKRAGTIKAVVEKGYMPPWKASNHNVEFSNDRRLTDDQKKTLLDWINADCPSGDLQKAPPPPDFPDGWTLGQPDLVVKMEAGFDIPADGPDIYRSFVFKLDLDEDKWVKAIELRPSARSAVHHALFFLDSSGNARKLDAKDGQAGIAGMGFLSDFGGSEGAGLVTQASGILNRLKANRKSDTGLSSEEGRIDASLDRGLGGYVPGAMPSLLPGDLALPLPKGADIVMQTHFHPTGKPEREQAELALYFAKAPPKKRLVQIQVPAMFGFGANINIPPEEDNYRVEDSFTLPIDVEAISVGGHAHYICKSMKMVATKPDGDEVVLLEIDEWDLDWQDRYLYATAIPLPAGTKVHSMIVYDNSSQNPENPYSPPRQIRWGRQSNDEMGSISLAVVASDESENPQLRKAVREHFTESLVDRFTKGRKLDQLLMQLDENRDGKLQVSEAPPRLTGRVFKLLDENKDDALDAEELAKIRKFTERFGNSEK